MDKFLGSRHGDVSWELPNDESGDLVDGGQGEGEDGELPGGVDVGWDRGLVSFSLVDVYHDVDEIQRVF